MFFKGRYTTIPKKHRQSCLQLKAIHIWFANWYNQNTCILLWILLLSDFEHPNAKSANTKSWFKRRPLCGVDGNLIKSILNALPCHSLLVVARVAVLNMQYLWFSAWIRAGQITGATSFKQRPTSSRCWIKLWFVCTTRTWLEMTGYTFRCFDDWLYLKV